ncbi:hypothetical protein ACT4UM_02525 [Bacillus sp. SS-TM]
MNDLLLTFFIFSPLLGILLLVLTPKVNSGSSGIGNAKAPAGS